MVSDSLGCIWAFAVFGKKTIIVNVNNVHQFAKYKFFSPFIRLRNLKMVKILTQCCSKCKKQIVAAILIYGSGYCGNCAINLKKRTEKSQI